MRFIIFSPNAHTLIYLYINIVTSDQYVSCSLQYASCAVLYALCMTLYASLAVQKFTRFHTLSWCSSAFQGLNYNFIISNRIIS